MIISKVKLAKLIENSLKNNGTDKGNFDLNYVIVAEARHN